MCTNCNLPLGPDAQDDAFAERLLGMLNEAALSMMLSIGHRTGLFDIMAGMPDATCPAIAEAAGLSERYVREWLGAMTTGRIVTHDPEHQTYTLPAGHAAHLTRAARADNIAQTMQWISVLGAVEDEVVRAFTDGGGVPYESYRRFNRVMADESDLTVVQALESDILALVPGMMDRLEAGIDVLDVGCGCGRAMIELAARFPKSRFVGYDIQESAIDEAVRLADTRGLANVRFRVQDAAAFTDTDAFDLICTFDSVHDQARPDCMLSNIARALRKGGVYLCQDIQGSSSHAGDIGHPVAPFIYTISCMHCMSVSLAQGGLGLGAAWGKAKAFEMMQEAGFRDIRVEELPHDFINSFYVAKPAA